MLNLCVVFNIIVHNSVCGHILDIRGSDGKSFNSQVPEEDDCHSKTTILKYNYIIYPKTFPMKLCCVVQDLIKVESPRIQVMVGAVVQQTNI